MPTVTCFVADINLTPDLPVIDDLSLQGQALSSYFKQASGTAQLGVVLDWSRCDRFPSLITSGGINDVQLYQALGQLLGSDGASSQSNIGLLLADFHTLAPDQYGVMFDIDDGEVGAFGPRQGCAVFLSAIKLAILNAGLEDTALREFVAYTAIHELGHTFNLWHTSDSSFMQPHPDPAHLGAFDFAPTHAQYLGLAADAATIDYVLPGLGRSHFGVRPHGWPAGDGNSFAGPSSQKVKLTLKVALSHATFWSFEPVELDVELSLSGPRSTAVAVPDEIDPGYSSFHIWITRPDGERFRFRAQSRFCQRNGERVITKDKPFRRDIAIFRQSGGYTFSVPGRYQVQAAFQLHSGLFLQSNIAECEVLPAAPRSATWASASAVLERNESRMLLRFKHRPPAHHSYARFIRFADEHASETTSSAIHYALGKALICAAQTTPHGTRADDLRRRGADHLRQSLGRGKLSLHRIEVATTLVSAVNEKA